MKVEGLDDLTSLIQELNCFRSAHDFYEHKESEILYRIPNMLKNQGGIDLRGAKAVTLDDVAQLCKKYTINVS